MAVERFVSRILQDEGLTSGLTDPEARLLVEYLVEQAEQLAEQPDQDRGWRQLQALCRWARGVRRFVELWCHRNAQGPAAQLAGAERYPWPLPTSEDTDPFDVMDGILGFHQKAGLPYAVAEVDGGE
jgi:hypothetical protein